MIRPRKFEYAYRATQNIPYICGDERSKSPSSGGVLGRGATFWTQAAEVSPIAPEEIVGFVEDIGIIVLSPGADEG
jgi:hypothetical protein